MTQHSNAIEHKRDNKHPSSATGSSKNKQGNEDSSNNKNVVPSTPNRPRNLLITDATQPFQFSFSRCGVLTTVTVHQTPDEATWPGGALWDLGVLLAQVLVRLTPNCSTKTTMKGPHLNRTSVLPKASKTSKSQTKSPSTAEIFNNSRSLPSRLLQALPDCKWNEIGVLELGCGVGLTGLVAATLGSKYVILTDLDVVIENVTARNVDWNVSGNVPVEQRLTKNLSAGNMEIYHRTVKTSGGHVLAMPLCWGNAEDEAKVKQVIDHFSQISCRSSFHSKTARPTSKRKETEAMTTSCQSNASPNLILIGDVAYQHKPGAPSHFEALQSTLLKFVNDNTVVLFGTRLRMPASADLLDLFLEHLEEMVVPPIAAEEIDPVFANQKHNIMIHVLRKKTNVPYSE